MPRNPPETSARAVRWLLLWAALVVPTSVNAQSGLAPATHPADASAVPMVPLPAGWRLARELMAGFPPEGLQLLALESVTGSPPLRAFCLVWDPWSPAIAFRPVLAATARTPTQFAAQDPAVVHAAVNAGFFGGNQSYSLVLADGVVRAPNIKALSRPLQGTATAYYPTRAAFGLGADGRFTTDWIYHVGAGNSLIYAYPAPSPNRLNAPPQPVPTAGFPAGGAPWVMQQAIGGSPVLVRNGESRITDEEELIEVNNTARRARTAIGHTASGLGLILAVEGDSAGFPGLTLAELSTLLRSLGATGAINLDGGGSTSLVVAGRTTVRPSDGQERPVMAAVLLADPARTATPTGSPVLVHAPWSLVAAAGAPATLQAVAEGGALTHQWFRDGQPIAGATSPALTFAAVTAREAGAYVVEVTNPRGRVASPPATLGITPAPPGELANLSVRAAGGPGEETLIAGFVLRERGETLLARAVGPGLGPLGVTGFLEDPHLAWLGPQGAVLAGNDDWEAPLATAATRVGAFALPAGSADAALQREAAPGPQMLAATPARGRPRGNLLVELYDPEPGGGILANLSARARVAPGSELIAGFVIRGQAAATVLIRAVGPSLGPLGVGEPLASPRLSLVRDGQVMMVNQRWSLAPNARDAREAARRTGAFALPGNSGDATLLVTLPPGAYTAVIAAADDGAGVALVEVYEVR